MVKGNLQSQVYMVISRSAARGGRRATAAVGSTHNCVVHSPAPSTKIFY